MPAQCAGTGGGGRDAGVWLQTHRLSATGDRFYSQPSWPVPVRNAIIFISIPVVKVARRAFTTPEPEHTHSLGRKRSTCIQLGKEMQERNNRKRPDRLTGGSESAQYPTVSRVSARIQTCTAVHTRAAAAPLSEQPILARCCWTTQSKKRCPAPACNFAPSTF